MEKWKKYYLQAVVLTLLKLEVINKFDQTEWGVSQVVVFLREELQRVLEIPQIDLKTAIKNFKSMSYDSSEIEDNVFHILSRIRSQTKIHNQNKKVYDFMEDLVIDPKRLMKSIKKRRLFRIKA